MMAAQFLLILLSLFTSVYSCKLDLVTSQTAVHIGHFDSTVITCKLLCPDDDVTDLRWYDNRNRPMSYAPLRVFATFYKESVESKLFLRDVKADDNGTYTCVAKTNKQTITKSVDVFITNTVSQYVGELIHDRERRANRNSTKIRVQNNKKNTVGKRTKKKQRNKERKNKNKSKGKKYTPKKMRPVQNPDLSKTTTKPAPTRSTRKPFTRKRTTTSDVKTTSVTSTVHHSTHDSDAVRNDLVTSSHWDTASSDTPSKTSNDITLSTNDVRKVDLNIQHSTHASSAVRNDLVTSTYLPDLILCYLDTESSDIPSKTSVFVSDLTTVFLSVITTVFLSTKFH